MKKLTIPRLELSAAVLAVHNDSLIWRELEIELHKSHFYTDSMIVLYYIHNEAEPLKTFVANRAAMIRRHSKPSQWCHIVSESNPADIACRGMNWLTFLFYVQ